MSERQIGSGHIYGLMNIAGTLMTMSGYFSASAGTPNLKTVGLSHSATISRIKNQAGVTSSIIGNDDMLELTVDFIPEGTSKALAVASAELPDAPSTITIAGAPIIKVGPWDDAFNTNGSGSFGATPWIYEGGGRINGIDDSHWTMNLVLHRYQGINSVTIIT